MTESFRRRRDLVVEGLRDIGLSVPTPGGAFYCMPEVPEGFVDECLERGVVVVPGEAFGEAGRGKARLSYATDDESLEAALDVMADAYDAVTA
jgi:aspartate aminotransferase